MTQAGSHGSESKSKTILQRLHKVLRPLPEPIDPALLEHERQRADERRTESPTRSLPSAARCCSSTSTSSGSRCWIGFGVENYPYGLLTMIVSLEAIFLSTFVMISQNRADAKRQVIADEQWTTVKEEDKQNVELLKLSKQILALTQEVRTMASAFRDQDEIAALT